MTTEELNEFYLMRKKAGLAIDPLTAEVFWSYAQTMDPYGSGVHLKPPSENITHPVPDAFRRETLDPSADPGSLAHPRRRLWLASAFG